MTTVDRLSEKEDLILESFHEGKIAHEIRSHVFNSINLGFEIEPRSSIPVHGNHYKIWFKLRGFRVVSVVTYSMLLDPDQLLVEIIEKARGYTKLTNWVYLQVCNNNIINASRAINYLKTCMAQRMAHDIRIESDKYSAIYNEFVEESRRASVNADSKHAIHELDKKINKLQKTMKEAFDAGISEGDMINIMKMLTVESVMGS
jgi:hypothetical protein